MKAVVLVGGEGTRLRPLTFTTPKQMLPVAGMTMIERVLRQLARFGVTEAILALGYRPDAFMAAFPGGHAQGVSLTYAVEDEPLDTAGALRFAAHHGGVDETFLVVNGDVLTELDVEALVALHRSAGASATLALTPVVDPSAFGVVPTDETGRVTAFIEKPPRHEAPTNYINAGTYVVEPGVLDLIPGGRRVSLERETFPSLVAEGSLYALGSDTYWIDVGTPAKLLQAGLDLLDGTRSGPPFPGATEFSPGLWADRDGTVEAELQAPCLVGSSSYLAPGARLASSLVGSNCVVGQGAVITGSLVLDGACIEAGAVVTDSILGFGSRVREGAELSELCVVGDRAEVDARSRHRAARIGAQ